MREVEFILYVADQERSKAFYSTLLQLQPSLDVPGMTEFQLSDSARIGIMPENGIAKILTQKVPHPSLGNGIPRCELYLKVEDAASYLDRGVRIGGVEISKLQQRDWGDIVGYLADPDGHIIAFAQKN